MSGFEVKVDVNIRRLFRSFPVRAATWRSAKTRGSRKEAKKASKRRCKLVKCIGNHHSIHRWVFKGNIYVKMWFCVADLCGYTCGSGHPAAHVPCEIVGYFVDNSVNSIRESLLICLTRWGNDFVLRIYQVSCVYSLAVLNLERRPQNVEARRFYSNYSNWYHQLSSWYL